MLGFAAFSYKYRDSYKKCNLKGENMNFKNIFKRKQKYEGVQLLTNAQMLHAIMAAKQINQKRLARELDVDEAQISRWLNGAIPKMENQRKIKNLYDEVMNNESK